MNDITRQIQDLTGLNANDAWEVYTVIDVDFSEATEEEIAEAIDEAFESWVAANNLTASL